MAPLSTCSTMYTVVVCMLSAAAFGLGVADVVMGVDYAKIFCPAITGVCGTTALTLTYVGVGIWAAVPIFMTGLFVKYIHPDSKTHVRTILLLTFLSTFIFGPAMTIISAIEVWQGAGVFYNVPTSNASPVLPTGDPSDVTKFAVPLAIAVIGFVLTMINFFYYFAFCCVNNCGGGRAYSSGAAAGTTSVGMPCMGCCAGQECCHCGCCLCRCCHCSVPEVDSNPQPVAITQVQPKSIATNVPVPACARCGASLGVTTSDQAMSGIIYSSQAMSMDGPSVCPMCRARMSNYATPALAYSSSAYVNPARLNGGIYGPSMQSNYRW